MIHLVGVDLGPGVAAWFTGRDPHGPQPAVGAAGNVSHRRPHRPADLVVARREIAERTGCAMERWHLMHQVHLTRVREIDERTPVGSEARGVDALVTGCRDRPLVVQVADCVPLLLAAGDRVAAVHSGRLGVAGGIVGRVLERLVDADGRHRVRAAIGPAIGGCCYEVPAELREEVASVCPRAWSTTRWGTPSLDLPAAVEAQLADAGVREVERLGICTLEDERFFSHRRDPQAGRQVGIVARAPEGRQEAA